MTAPSSFVLPDGYHPYRSALIGSLGGGPLVPLFLFGYWWIALLWLALVAVAFWLVEYPLRTWGMTRARRRHFLAECAAGRHQLPCGWCGKTLAPNQIQLPPGMKAGDPILLWCVSGQDQGGAA